jgi:hypothetical protein
MELPFLFLLFDVFVWVALILSAPRAPLRMSLFENNAPPRPIFYEGQEGFDG